MKATTREDLNLKEDETMCERCVHENICRREQCGEPYCVICSCFDFEEKRLRGEWIEGTQGYYCSRCNEIDQFYFDHSFCPICGSDNRGTGK